MMHLEGASAPFPFYSWCATDQRPDALLSHALKAYQDGDFADALLAVEAVSRSANTLAFPLILRARIIEACRPELAAKAWYCAWLRDPENPVLQDALLNCWLRVGADQKVRELGRLLLPGRCQHGTQAQLLDLLKRAGTTQVGACWVASKRIFGRVFQLDESTIRHDYINVHNESNGHIRQIILTGEQSNQFELSWPDNASVLSITLGDSLELLAGSPLSSPLCLPTLQTGAHKRHQAKPPQVTGKKKSSQTIDIIVPVFRGLNQVKACLESVLRSLPLNKQPARIVVVDDASPEPLLSSWLNGLNNSSTCIVLRNPHNLGFVETVNRGLAFADGHDVVILNADTLVHGNWLDRMHDSLYASPDLASVTAWSNNAEISSFPAIGQPTYAPSEAELAEIDTICANLAENDIEIPSCCGFAMMIRRSVLNQIGYLDGAGFGRGYSEEVDWCLRARANGYRHHLAVKVFIAHVGGISFGIEKVIRVRQNRKILQARYPNYYAEYHQFLKVDGLQRPRRTLLSTLSKHLWLLRQNTTPTLFLPQALPTRRCWLAVWNFKQSSAYVKQILALARAMSSLPEPGHIRLLVCGEITNSLFHTGVVDHLPHQSLSNSLMSDAALLAMCGCTLVLAEPGEWIWDDLPCYPLNKDFNPTKLLAQLVLPSK